MTGPNRVVVPPHSGGTPRRCCSRATSPRTPSPTCRQEPRVVGRAAISGAHACSAPGCAAIRRGGARAIAQYCEGDEADDDHHRDGDQRREGTPGTAVRRRCGSANSMRRRNRANRRRRSRDQSSGDPRLGAHDITANRRRRRRARAADAIRPRRRYTGLGRRTRRRCRRRRPRGDGAQRGHRGRRAAFSARLEHARTDRGARSSRPPPTSRRWGAHHRVLVAGSAVDDSGDVVVGINREWWVCRRAGCLGARW